MPLFTAINRAIGPFWLRILNWQDLILLRAVARGEKDQRPEHEFRIALPPGLVLCPVLVLRDGREGSQVPDGAESS
jgi:hypothetical protein